MEEEGKDLELQKLKRKIADLRAEKKILKKVTAIRFLNKYKLLLENAL